MSIASRRPSLRFRVGLTNKLCVNSDGLSITFGWPRRFWHALSAKWTALRAEERRSTDLKPNDARFAGSYVSVSWLNDAGD